MDRENFYHWGATREIMEIIRRRNNSPETRRLVEQKKSTIPARNIATPVRPIQTTDSIRPIKTEQKEQRGDC